MYKLVVENYRDLTRTNAPEIDAPKPPKHTESFTLPNEIWLKIFHHATFVSGSLDIDHDDPFASDVRLWNTVLCLPVDALFPSIRLSNSTKLRLMLVGKRWHDLVQPLLYESILLSRTQDMAQLASTLLKAAANSTTPDDSSIPLGHRTRRLSLSMRDLPTGPAYANVPVLLYLADIFRSMPNLQILVIGAPRPLSVAGSTTPPLIIPEQAWNALVTTAGSSLLRLEHTIVDNLVPSATVRGDTVLRGFSRLRTVHPHVWISTVQACSLCALQLPSIASGVEISNRMRGCPCEQDASNPPYPSLSTVVISSTSPAAGKFLAIQGSRLKTIVLSDFSPERQRRALGYFREYCPNVTRLIVYINEIDLRFEEKAHDLLFLLPPSVTHLGLFLNYTDWVVDGQSFGSTLTPELALKWLCRGTPDLPATVGSLKSLRFFNPSQFPLDSPSMKHTFGAQGLRMGDGSIDDFAASLHHFESRGILIEGFCE